MAYFEMPSTPVRTRIAPSPTGDPHVGTAYIALFNKALAVKSGGKFILRIEDTDRARYVEGSEQMIFDALRWLGLDFDEGPDRGGPFAPYRQSERSEIYRKHAQMLLDNGTAYRCFCTEERLEHMRKEQLRLKIRVGYDGACRALPKDEVDAKLAAGEAHVIRLKVPKEGETVWTDGFRGSQPLPNVEIDDQVLMKSKDGLPTYHLANVVDDRLMGVTHVIRAEEWIASTAKHVLLYKAFGWPAPQFCHMPLLRNADKSKISKRKNPTNIMWYRDEGFLPEALLNFLGLMGYSMPDGREIFSRDEFIADFDLTRVTTTGPVFDMKKLEWLNGEWIRLRITPEDFAQRITKFFGAKYAGREDLVKRIVPLIQPRLKKLKDWPDLADPFFFGCAEYPATDLHGKKTAVEAAQILDRALAIVEKTEWAPKPLEEACRTAAKELGMKDGDFFMPLRIGVMGRKVSPPLFESMEVLGKDESVRRLRAARAKL